MVHQGYIEPQTCTVFWRQDGRLTVWNSSQGQFGMRDQIGRLLDVPVSEIKVVPLEIGGGFGGKLRAYLEPTAALLSKKSGHPVKITMSRADVLEATGPTSGSYISIKIGATKTGKLIAGKAFIAFESGAYPGSSHNGAAISMFSPYDIGDLHIDSYDVVDNKPSTAAYRAPGAPIGAFAGESVIDEIAEKLGIDPVELRLMNAAKEGTRMINGVMHPRIGAVKMMEAVRDHSHYSAPIEGANVGRGVAFGSWGNGAGPACVIANVQTNGKVSLVEGSVDIGGTRTAVSQQFAEVLGIPVEDVMPQIGDTDSIGFTSNTGGSSATFKSGYAAYQAALDVKRQLIERAALAWDVSVEEVEYDDGVLSHISDPDLKISYQQIAETANTTGGPIVGRANVTSTGAGRAYAAMIVDVHVDPDTGKTDVLRCTAFQDAGVAIHPSYVEGQIQGGAVQGIGWALNEEYNMSDDGRLNNNSFLDYRMPTSLDMPMIEAVIVEVPNPNHPFGVRGVGEAGIVAPLAAMANAVYGATGRRMTELPMSPPATMASLRKHGNLMG
jgi:CO/xanthine dehydrogenase Mo-binding subunit